MKISIRRIIVCLLIVFLLFSGIGKNTDAYAEEDTRDHIIVSLGDSYASGEGIPPFYGQDDIEQWSFYKPADWLAHRSEYSWSGMLTLPGVSGCMADHRDTNWFFVAASGAQTVHLQQVQNKKVNHTDLDTLANLAAIFPNVDYSFDLPPQLEVFDYLDANGLKADYVTVSLGGNDVYFADIVTKAAIEGSYLSFYGLQKQINGIWIQFDSTIQYRIKEAYKTIAEKAGKQATVIVVGYPTLLCEKGSKVFFNDWESKYINEQVREFNKRLEKIVESLREEQAYNVHFVSVESAFKNHEAYTDHPYMNGIIVPSQKYDLDITKPASSYSMHPNFEGAKQYAECVQAKIDELEKKRAEQAADAKRADWSKAYRAFAQEKEYLSFSGVQFGSDEGCIQFALHDFERDGIPELLIGNGSDTHLNGGAYVFAYRDGQIRCLGDIASDPGGLGLFSSDDSYYTGLFWTESFQGSRGTLYYYIDEKGELARELVESGEFENRETFSGEYHLRSRTGDDELFTLAQEPGVIELVTFDYETVQRNGWDNFVAFYQRIWDSMMHWQTGEQHPGIPRGASVGKDPTPTPKKTPTPSPKKTPTPSPKKTPASAEEVWKRLYMDLIESGSYEQWLEINDAAYEGQGFALHDMDGDGTPELIFLDGGEWHQYFSQVCTIKNGSVQYMGRLRAPMGSLRGEDGDLWYHYYENSEYPGLFVEIPIAGYYKNLSDFYCGYFHVTPGGQIIEDVVEASASGSILEKTSDERLYRLIKNAKAIPLRFIELEDLLGGGWDRLWASWAGAPANTINH